MYSDVKSPSLLEGSAKITSPFSILFFKILILSLGFLFSPKGSKSPPKTKSNPLKELVFSKLNKSLSFSTTIILDLSRFDDSAQKLQTTTSGGEVVKIRKQFSHLLKCLFKSKSISPIFFLSLSEKSTNE